MQGTGLSLSHAAFTKPQVAWHAGQLKTLTHKKKVPQISEHAGDCPALKKNPIKEKAYASHLHLSKKFAVVLNVHRNNGTVYI